MKNLRTWFNSPLTTKHENVSRSEVILLKWIETIITGVCFIVLIYTIHFYPSNNTIKWNYINLVTTEIILLIIAIILYWKEKLTLSSNLLILAGVIGPWWSAIIDPAVKQGNLLPLGYLTVPIIFTSFFSPIIITVIVGIIQIVGLVIFVHVENFDMSKGAASLLFFVIYIFALSLIINIQNRNNRRTISRQVEKLKELAIRDPLTGLYNRRFPIEFLQKQFTKMNRNGGNIAFIFMDVDNLKFYNDTYGHNFGDMILVTLSKILIKNFRESDICCRFGGDEFFIAMNDVNLDEASMRAEDLRKMIEKELIKGFCEEEIQVTVSFGIASYPKHGKLVDDVLKAADQALYKAKELGKNKVVVMD